MVPLEKNTLKKLPRMLCPNKCYLHVPLNRTCQVTCTYSLASTPSKASVRPDSLSLPLLSLILDLSKADAGFSCFWAPALGRQHLLGARPRPLEYTNQRSKGLIPSNKMAIKSLRNPAINSNEFAGFGRGPSQIGCALHIDSVNVSKLMWNLFLFEIVHSWYFSGRLMGFIILFLLFAQRILIIKTPSGPDSNGMIIIILNI